MMTQKEIETLELEAEIELRKYPGVVGVGYGLKEINGQMTNQLGLSVYVVKKKDKRKLKSAEIIPSEFEGIPTDVIKAADFQLDHCEDMRRHSPLIGGISITNKSSTNIFRPGTLGFFATIKRASGPENVVLVSNNHILMANKAKVGDTIFQPEFGEQNGQVLVDDTKDLSPIGKIHNPGFDGNHSYQYQGSGVGALDYYIDCASAKLDFCISSWCHTHCGVEFRNEIRGLNINNNNAIDDVARVQQSDLGTGNYVVYKVGRRTGRTVGRVTHVNFPLANQPKRVIRIEASRIEPGCDDNGILRFSNRSDSGSALINAQNQLVGLVFSHDPDNLDISFACHIHPVLDRLDVTAITAANPHSGAETVSNHPGVITDEGFNHTLLLREKLLKTEQGREIYNLVLIHRFEVSDLVNHSRPVTVAWHRNKGPAFLSNFINNARDPDHLIPHEIEGVNLEVLLRKMVQVLSIYGSNELKAGMEEYLDEVIIRTKRFDNLHELAEQFDPVNQHG